MGRRVIGLGDAPEPVGHDLERGKAEIGRLEREREEEGFTGETVEGLGIREVRR